MIFLVFETLPTSIVNYERTAPGHLINFYRERLVFRTHITYFKCFVYIIHRKILLINYKTLRCILSICSPEFVPQK